MFGFGPISSTPVSALLDPTTTTSVPFVNFRLIYTLELNIRNVSTNTDFTLYAGTEEYVTRSSDTPSGTPFSGTLERLPQFDRSIISGDGFSGLTNGWGDVGLINVGDYDTYIRGYAVDGRRAVFKRLFPDYPYVYAQTIADLTAVSIGVEGQMLTVGFRDNSFKLDVPTQPEIYAGTGDAEGGLEMAGKRRNMALGVVKNITPVLLIPGELVLEVNGGRAVQAISAAYDKGYPLDGPEADYADLAALRAATVTDGWYATCLAEGRFRTGASYQQITCDVNGDNVGGYVNTTGTIMRRIISITECVSDPSEVDIYSFAALEVDQPATIGYYLDENSTETVADTFSKLTKGIGGWCGFNRLGLLQAGVFEAPTGTPIMGFYTDLEVLDVAVERLPSGMDPPPWRQRVPYEKNWTVISDPLPGVADVDPSRSAWLTGPYKLATTSQVDGDAILADHLLAQDPPVKEAYFALEIDALAEANRVLTLTNSSYVLYRLHLKAPPFYHDVDELISVDLNRFGLNGGRLLRLASVSDRPDDDSIEVRGFG